MLRQSMNKVLKLKILPPSQSPSSIFQLLLLLLHSAATNQCLYHHHHLIDSREKERVGCCN
jgi:hypothetical protein